MLPPNLVGILLVWSLFWGLTEAHTIPTLVIESEFTPQRTATFKVNLDPRLFLSAQPTSLPPVPATWWFDQDENTQTESRKKAGDYINKTLAFKVGETLLKGVWQTKPIDSTSAFPLEATSAEVHLMAEYTGQLPDTDGLFSLEVSKNCPVGLILVNSMEGVHSRKPQSLFAGETSIGFPLPAMIRAKVNPFTYGWLAIPALLILLLGMRRWKQ